MRFFKINKYTQNTIKYIDIFVVFGYAITFLFLSISRISYPYGLEGMEGTHLIEVHRILNNQQLYTSPSLDFVPLIYPPLYFYLSVILSKIVGFGFFPLRLLSLVATIGCVALIFVLVFKETKNSFSAVISSGLFLATYNLTDSWFDLARIDMVFVFFLMLGVFFVRYYTNTKGAIISGLVLSFCLLTKQTAFIFILPLLIYTAVFRTIKYSLIITGTFLFFSITTLLLINTSSSGWLYYYLFNLPQNHHISLYSSLTFWLNDILKPLGIAIIIGLFYFFHRQKENNSKNETFYLIIFLSFLLGSWIARSNIGGAGNTLIPAYLVISILFGFGINRVVMFIDKCFSKKEIMQLYIQIIILIQFVTLVYNPFSLMPTENHKNSMDRIINEIEKTPGEVFIPSHNYLSLMSGKKPYMNTFALYEFTGNYGGIVSLLGDEILMELDNALVRKDFDLIITDLTDQEFFTNNLEEHYTESNYYELEKKNALFSVYREYSNSVLNFYEIKD